MIDVVKHRQNKNPLPVIDLLLLNEFDGKQENYEIPAYRVEEFGKDYLKRVQRLLNDGYLKFSSTEESLNSLTIPRLKDILRGNNQKLSGNKSELVKRILENIPSKNYEGFLPKIYKLSPIGRKEIENRSAYIENKQQQYGFLNSEIESVEKTLPATEKNSAGKIFEKLFARNMLKHQSEKNFGLLRNNYFLVHKFLIKRGRIEESLRALLTVIYFDLSGMSNDNFVEEYYSRERLLDTSIWGEIDKEKTALNLSDDTLMKLFEESVRQTVKLPFSYFEIETMKSMILDRLHGQMNLFERYEKYRNVPSEDNPHYEYFDFSREQEFHELPEEISPKKAAATSGCLLPCLFFFLILITIFAVTI